MLFYNSVSYVNNYNNIVSVMLSVILISILIKNIFLISDILAYGQQILKEKVITATEKGKRIGSNLDDRNNAITNSKLIQNNNNNMQYDPTVLNNRNDNINKVIILTFGDTEKSQLTAAKPILDQFGAIICC